MKSLLKMLAVFCTAFLFCFSNAFAAEQQKSDTAKTESNTTATVSQPTADAKDLLPAVMSGMQYPLTATTFAEPVFWSIQDKILSADEVISHLNKHGIACTKPTDEDCEKLAKMPDANNGKWIARSMELGLFKSADATDIKEYSKFATSRMTIVVRQKKVPETASATTVDTTKVGGG